MAKPLSRIMVNPLTREQRADLAEVSKRMLGLGQYYASGMIVAMETYQRYEATVLDLEDKLENAHARRIAAAAEVAQLRCENDECERLRKRVAELEGEVEKQRAIVDTLWHELHSQDHLG